jgi:hypothetical protein
MGGFKEKLQRLKSSVDKGLDKVNTGLGYAGKSGPFQADQQPLNSGNKFNYRDHFLRMMENWEFSIPNQFMWIGYIDPYPAALNARDFIVYEGSDGTKKPNNIDTDVKKLTSDQYQRTDAGCVFINGMSIPAEQYVTEYVNLPAGGGRGFIPGLVGQNRASFNPVTTRIIESNLSFTHSIIRPWLILASHYGLVARPAGDIKNIKTTLQVIQLGKTTANSPLINRKIFRFYNCVPISYTPMDLPYNATDLQTFDIQWAYSHYNVESLPETDVNIIIQEAQKYPFVGFLDKLTDGKASKFMSKAEKVADRVKKASRAISRGKRAIDSLGDLF